MGFTNSPTWYHSALKQSLKGCTFEGPVLVQYGDDLLLASKDKETHKRDLTTLVDTLADQGHKVSYEKAQLPKKEVTYLGVSISKGRKHITQDRVEIMHSLARPNTPCTLRKMLGVFNYVRHFIPSFSEIAEPLTELTKRGKGPHESIEWNQECEEAFVELKKQLCQAPALGLPNLKLPFKSFVHEQEGHCSAVVTQNHGGRERPAMYWRKSLDSQKECYRALGGYRRLKWCCITQLPLQWIKKKICMFHTQ
jgi:hypothetical protein